MTAKHFDFYSFDTLLSSLSTAHFYLLDFVLILSFSVAIVSAFDVKHLAEQSTLELTTFEVVFFFIARTWCDRIKCSYQIRRSHLGASNFYKILFESFHWVLSSRNCTAHLITCTYFRVDSFFFYFFCSKSLICRQLSYFVLKVIKRYSSTGIKTLNERTFCTYLSFCMPFILRFSTSLVVCLFTFVDS